MTIQDEYDELVTRHGESMVSRLCEAAGATSIEHQISAVKRALHTVPSSAKAAETFTTYTPLSPKASAPPAQLTKAASPLPARSAHKEGKSLFGRARLAADIARSGIFGK